jgi:hypothetical protein
MPASPRLIAGFNNSASAGAIGCTSGRLALDFGDFPGGFFGSELFAMGRIWDESGGHERAKEKPGRVPDGMLSARCQQAVPITPRARRHAPDAGWTMSSWMLPQRTQRSVQYSEPARPPITRITERLPGQSGHCDRTPRGLEGN